MLKAEVAKALRGPCCGCIRSNNAIGYVGFIHVGALYGSGFGDSGPRLESQMESKPGK